MHQPSGGIGGTASDIAIQAEQMLYVKKTLAERIAFHTGQPLEQIERDSDRDRWFTAEEAKDYGLVDHVVRSARQVHRRAAGMTRRLPGQRSTTMSEQTSVTRAQLHAPAEPLRPSPPSSSARRTASRR